MSFRPFPNQLISANAGNGWSDEFSGKGAEALSFDVTNNGPAALTGLWIELRFRDYGPWHQVVGNADFTAPTADPDVLKVSNVNPATLASGAATWASVRLPACSGVRIGISSAGAASVTVGGGIR